MDATFELTYHIDLLTIVFDKLHDRVPVVYKGVDACYMWIQIKRVDLRELYIAICYFPPAYSRFAPLGESPYLPLYEDIIRFATMGDNTSRRLQCTN